MKKEAKEHTHHALQLLQLLRLQQPTNTQTVRHDMFSSYTHTYTHSTLTHIQNQTTKIKLGFTLCFPFSLSWLFYVVDF